MLIRVVRHVEHRRVWLNKQSVSEVEQCAIYLEFTILCK